MTTETEKIEDVGMALTSPEARDSFYDNHWCFLRGLLIIADLDAAKDGGRAILEIYDEDDVIAWHDAAIAAQRDDPTLTLYEALHECGYEPEDLA